MWQNTIYTVSWTVLSWFLITFMCLGFFFTKKGRSKTCLKSCSSNLLVKSLVTFQEAHFVKIHQAVTCSFLLHNTHWLSKMQKVTSGAAWVKCPSKLWVSQNSSKYNTVVVEVYYHNKCSNSDCILAVCVHCNK